MPSRKIEDCHPTLQPLLTKFLAQCSAAGLNILVTCTYRSEAEQAIEYAKGRTTPGPKTTNAKPGQSRHNFTVGGKPASLAFDIVPLLAGKATWKVTDPAWRKAAEIGRSLGLEWAGDWVSFPEFPHFQIPFPR